MIDDPERRPTMTALLGDLERAIAPALVRSRVWIWFQAAVVAVCAAIVTSTVVLASVCSPPNDGREQTTKWAIELALELAAESVENGDGQSTVKYLSLAHSRALRNFDRYGERVVADDALELGRQLALQGDIVNARECWSIARRVFHDHHDERGVQRVIDITRELTGSAATRSPPRNK